MSLPFGIEHRRLVFTYFPLLPYNTCNHAALIHKEEDNEYVVDEVIDFFTSRSFPYAYFRVSPCSHPETLVPTLEDRGFKEQWEESIMIFEGEPKIDLSIGLEINTISKQELAMWIDVAAEVFGVPSSEKEGYYEYVLEHLKRGGRCFLASLEGEPVGTSMLYSMNRVGSIFTVGTLTNYRRRGVGTAVTMHSVLQSMDDGNKIHTLQVGEGEYAEQLYQKLGFKTDHRITWYMKRL